MQRYVSVGYRDLRRAALGAALALVLCASPVVAQQVVLFAEDFDGLTLGPNVDEFLAGDNVWTDIPPSGWTVDRSDMTAGVTEWRGWNFADPNWWVSAVGDQRRSEFVLGTGVVAIADADEWDDLPHPGGPPNGPWFNSFLITPAISLAAVSDNMAVITFDSSWRGEFDSNFHQTGNVTVAFDGGSPVEIFRWESDATSSNFKADNTNETVDIFVTVPGGANQMVVAFGLFDAGNDWWWAIDNLRVTAVGGAPVPSLSAPGVGVVGLLLALCGSVLLARRRVLATDSRTPGA